MPQELSPDNPVLTAIRMFPDAVIMPNAGCVYCASCELITSTGVCAIMFHHPACPVRPRP